MKVNLPVVFSQYDTRWASLILGYNTDPKFNFYNYACLICCLAMVSKYYGRDDTPVTINDKLKGLGQNAGYQTGSGNYIWSAYTKLYTDIKEWHAVTPAALTDAQMADIKTALDNRFPVMVELDVNPRTVTRDSHFVLLVDYDNNDENNFTIADPLGGKIRSLKDYLGWFKPGVRNTIEQYAIYRGPVPAVTDDMMLVPKNIWPGLVHNSDQWDKTVAEYRPGSDPKSTAFEDVRAVVSGIKSRVTDLENQLKEARTGTAALEQEIKNQADKLANVTAECQRKYDLLMADYNALKETVPEIEKLRGQYEGTIADLEGRLREAEKNGGLKDLEIVKLQEQIKLLNEGAAELTVFRQFIEFLRKILIK